MKFRQWRTFIILVMVACLPVIIWSLQANQPMNVWILDKTVPYPDYREHKGLSWVLNHFKVEQAEDHSAFKYDRDYYGFFPQADGKYTIKDLPTAGDRPDLIYIADTYGVYEDDYLTADYRGERSSLIYGGLTGDDLFAIQKNLSHNTIIAEFNSMASPTGSSSRAELEQIMGVHWEEWMGRYFDDLSRGGEVPDWMVANYEQQYQKSWNFTGPGFTLVSNQDQVQILEMDKDIGPKALKLSFAPEYQEEFGIKGKIPYYYWFEWMKPSPGTEVLANYHLDLSKEGTEKLKKIGLPVDFPAVMRRADDQYTGYYFAGDFADSNEVPRWYKIKGLATVKKYLSIDIRGSSQAFYWKAYVPLMHKILEDIDVDHKPVADPISIYQENGTKMVARTSGEMIQIYQDEQWKDVFIKGVNLGIALPGKWFTEFPKDRNLYMQWFQQMGSMHANTIRVYTLLDPAFYQTLLLYNQNHPDAPLYLLQEIWPEEGPLGNNLLGPEYMKEWELEIQNGIDAIHGNASIPERRGRAYGEYKADVSAYVMAYLVGRELEPEEVIATNEQNKGYTFNGRYLTLASGSPAEAWLAQSCDRVLDYEDKTYHWQHPTGIVSWPTLDPMEHDSEWNLAGDKDKEYNDKVAVDINHIDEGEAMLAGFFGAYHIYPNYPDFMNNEASYDAYQDEEGRLRYGAYLKDFMAQHSKYPALVAEFGLANGMATAHANPDGYHHGGLSEEAQGKGIVRMMKAIQREHYAGGVIFEWMDEWAKKTWTTEPFMIPYEHNVFWHNAIDPEQNYGLLAMEPNEPATDYRVNGQGVIKKLFLRANESYLYIDIETNAVIEGGSQKWLIGLDTYARDRGEFLYQQGVAAKAPSGMEFLLELQGQQGRFLVIPSYNLSRPAYSSVVANQGLFEEIRPLINKAVVTKDGRKIPEIREDASNLKYGSYDQSDAQWFITGNQLHIRLPWGKLNISDPTTYQVLDDSTAVRSDLLRDELHTVKTEGIIATAVMLDSGQKIIGTVPGMNKDKSIGLPATYQWKTWQEPVVQPRLKKSYTIVQQYFKTLH